MAEERQSDGVFAGMSAAQMKLFKTWQFRTIVVTVISYAIFYFVRKNLSMAMPALEADLGITKAHLGGILTLHGLLYGLSKFVNGMWGDRSNARIFMSTGLILAACVNICFGFSTSLTALGFFWILNAWFQGMGVPPCTRLMTHWVPPSELATKMSIWNTSHSIGAGLAVIFCGYVVAYDWSWTGFAAWRWCFILPGAIAILGAGFVWLGIRDTPSSVGLPEMNLKIKNTEGAGTDDDIEFKEFLRKHVFMNPIIWAIAVGNFFVYVVRFAILDWGPTMLKEHLHLDLSHAGWMVAGFEVAGIVGMLLAGWITDKVLKGRAVRTCVFCMIFAAACMSSLWLITPQTPTWVAVLTLMAGGFFIYGPQALVGIAAANIATKRAAATAGGFCGLFGYGSTMVSGIGMGMLVQYSGWNTALFCLILSAIIGAGIFALAWNSKPTSYQ